METVARAGLRIAKERKPVYTIQIFTPESMRCLGSRLGGLLRPGDVVCLNGELGAGKTTLAQGIALGLGVAEPVTSPTFTIIHEYQGRLPLYHMDAYRLANPLELADLGLDEYLYGNGVTVIEWAGKVIDLLPFVYLAVDIEYLDAGAGRRVTLRAQGDEMEILVGELQKELQKTCGY